MYFLLFNPVQANSTKGGSLRSLFIHLVKNIDFLILWWTTSIFCTINCNLIQKIQVFNEYFNFLRAFLQTIATKFHPADNHVTYKSVICCLSVLISISNRSWWCCILHSTLDNIYIFIKFNLESQLIKNTDESYCGNVTKRYETRQGNL